MYVRDTMEEKDKFNGFVLVTRPINNYIDLCIPLYVELLSEITKLNFKFHLFYRSTDQAAHFELLTNGNASQIRAMRECEAC